jgi:hypothetical protein
MGAALFDPRVLDAILALVAIEGLGFAVWRALTGTGPATGGLIATLAAGAGLLLAFRASLSGGSPATIAGFLAAALIAHAIDLGRRLNEGAPRRNSEVDSARERAHG